MVTKEHKSRKYCCFYVSEFHLEMILLPYIKENLEKYKINIFTQENLLESMKVLLDRTNLKNEDKNKIINLNWNKTDLEDICLDDSDENIIIVNGDESYIEEVNKNLRNLNNISVVDCYNVNRNDINVNKIQEKYSEILNTKHI